MEVTLNVLRCPDSVVPEMRHVTGGEYRIGRGAECEWVLPDPDRVLSKQHCVVYFRNGGWEVRDTSTNGTFLNGAGMPIGRDLTALLHDGDRIRLGPYEIEVKVQAGAQQAPGGSGQPDWGTPPPAAQPQWDAPLPASAPWGGTPQPAFGQPGGQQGRPQPIQPRLPGDAFPIGGQDAPPLPGLGGGHPTPVDPRFSDIDGPPMPDHVAPLNHAFYTPQPLPPPDNAAWSQPLPPPGSAAPPPSGGQPPPGWSLDLGGLGAPAAQPAPGFGAPPSPPPPPAQNFAPPPAGPAFAPHPPPPDPAQQGFAPPPPFAPQPSPAPGFAAPPPAPPPFAAPAPPPPAPAAPMAHPPAMPGFDTAPPTGTAPASGPNPFENEASLRAPGMAPIAPAVPIPAPPPVAPLAQDVPAHPHAPPSAMPAPASAMHAPPTAGAGADAGLSALLAGMGIAAPPALSADPAATLRAAGAALRAAISGLRALLIARADVKREFRIEATMLGTANNPVKFSHNDDAALLALLGPAGHGPASVQDAVNDLTAHQVATLAATQAAARALLERLAPAGVESADQGGSLFGASREKRLWEAYKKLHEQVGQQFEDDFDSAFGKAFARAYEQALRNGRG